LFGSDSYVTRDDNPLDPEIDAEKIRAFFVHPDWVRKGIWGIILRASEDAAREMGGTWSRVPFYGRIGYKEAKWRR
jgi:GNAT superfamily N-acetyltransferase